MRKLVGLVLLIVAASCASDNKCTNKITISGKANYPNNGFIYLELLTPDGYEKVDSCKLKKDNSFQLHTAKGDDEIYRINFFNIQTNAIPLTNQDVYIEADGNSAFGSFLAKGTKEIEAISHAYQLDFDYLDRDSLLNAKINMAGGMSDTKALDSFGEIHEQLELQYYNELKQIVWSQQGNLVALHLLSENFEIEENLDFYAEQIRILKGNLGDHWYLKRLISYYSNTKKLAVGSVAPEFGLPDPEGKLVKLSFFRGKYLFLDFWASWCQPCRIENPDLVKLYQKYHDRNFEILGISLDKKKERWIEAIKKDGLVWSQVSDLKYFESEMIEFYNIENVPMTFLLDPEGKIIAKNIHASELESILDGLL